ncbi:TPA: autotransporter outer membrane beta-barrel domain-containing protein, partial [Campylobacter jejuni]
MGIWSSSQGTLNIDKFENSGTITTSSDKGTVFFEGNTNIQTFTNTGTIKNTGNTEPSDYATISTGIYLLYSTIKNFNNEGLISGITGLSLFQTNIDNFTNKGTIESTSSNKNAAAISVNTANGKPSVINNFTNEGTIKSNSNGILAEAGNKIETLVNKGTIEASLNGISFYDVGWASGDKIELGKIILETGSSIKAGNNGINIDNGSSKAIKADIIEVKKGASVSGNNAGIYLGGGKEINAQITIAGEVSGGAAGIVNEGIIGGSSDNDDKKGGIIISGGSVSSSSGGSGIVNQGNGSIAGEIKVESGGSVEGGITNTGSGSISGNIVVEDGGKLDSITNTSTSDTGISGS